MPTYCATLRHPQLPAPVLVRLDAPSLDAAAAAFRSAAADLHPPHAPETFELVSIQLDGPPTPPAPARTGLGPESQLLRRPVRTIAAGVFLALVVWTLFALAAALFYRYLTTPAPIGDATWV